jgi:uncharacterized protein YjiS (DUF1127 family)
MSDLTLDRFVATRQPTGRATAAPSIAALRIALRTYLTRQALPELTARELSDIGLTRYAALTEVARLPWDTDPGPRRRAPQGMLAEIQRAWQRTRTRRLLASMNPRENCATSASPRPTPRPRLTSRSGATRTAAFGSRSPSRAPAPDRGGTAAHPQV